MADPATDKSKKKLRRKKRKGLPKKSFFLRGIITILPAVLTLFLLVTVVQFAQTYVTQPINSTIYWSLERNALGWKVLKSLDIDPTSQRFLDPDGLPPDAQEALRREGVQSEAFKNELTILRDPELGFFRDLDALAINPYKLRSVVRTVVHPLVGVLVSVLVVLTIGYFASGFLGRRMVSAFDKTAKNLPVIRSVYPYAKQLVEFFTAETEFDFDTVVAAPYPTDGVWAIAFVTGPGLKSIHDALGDRYVSLFVPTSPMPMTGFTVFIREDRLIPLPISVDEALRVTVSAGVLIPVAESPEEITETLERLGAEPEDDEEEDQQGTNA